MHPAAGTGSEPSHHGSFLCHTLLLSREKTGGRCHAHPPGCSFSASQFHELLPQIPFDLGQLDFRFSALLCGPPSESSSLRPGWRSAPRWSCCRVSMSTTPRSASLAVSMVPILSISAFLLQQLVGHVGDRALGRRGLAGVVKAQRQDHLALPQRDGVDQRGLDLFRPSGCRCSGAGGSAGAIWMEIIRVSSRSWIFLSKRSHQVGAGRCTPERPPGRRSAAPWHGAAPARRCGTCFQLLLAGQDIHGQFLIVLAGSARTSGPAWPRPSSASPGAVPGRRHDLVHVALGLVRTAALAVRPCLILLLAGRSRTALLLIFQGRSSSAPPPGWTAASPTSPKILGAHLVQGVSPRSRRCSSGRRCRTARSGWNR